MSLATGRLRMRTLDDVLATHGGRRSELIRVLDPSDLASLLEASAIVDFQPRDPLSSTQNPDDALHVVLEGGVIERSWHHARSGAYVRPAGPGDVLGLTFVLNTAEVGHPSEIRALNWTSSLRIPGRAVRGMLTASRSLATAVAGATAEALARAEADLVVLRVGDARTRVIWRLVELMDRWGTQAVGGVDVRLPLTQEDLGDWSGTSRESTVKCLQWLRRREIITTSRRHIHVIAPRALEQLATRRG